MRRPERWPVLWAWLLTACAVVVSLVIAADTAADDATLACPPRVARAVPELPRAQRAGLLWEVRAPNGAVGHLLGTIHLAVAEVAPTPQVRALLEQSRRFGMEVLFDVPTLTTLAQAMWTTEAAGLGGQAEPTLYARAVRLLEAYGIDAATARTLKVWAAYTTLSLPPAQTGPPLDLQLMTSAQAAGHPLFGIETLDEQLAVFESLGPAAQVDLLRETVCHYEAQQRDLARLVDAYARRDLGAIHREALRYESAAQSRLMKTLLDERNERMATRLQPRFDEAGTFAAVGALHLPGPGGLLERLSAAGYTVRALD